METSLCFAATADFFGNKNGSNYGWMFTAGEWPVFGPQLAGVFKDSAGNAASPVVWMTPFIIAGVACVIGGVIMILTNLKS
ncbi:MAG: hypothetical protein R2759_20695 [Bacteroidales bacterium]